MAEIIQILLIGTLTILSLAAYVAVIRVLFPARVNSAAQILEEMPGMALLIGLVNAVFISAIILFFFALANWTGVEIFTLPALILLLAFGVIISIGLSGFIQLLGGRLVPDRGSLGKTFLGTAIVSLACALPFIGWFGLLVYVLLTSLGAFILSLFSHRGGSLEGSS